MKLKNVLSKASLILIFLTSSVSASPRFPSQDVERQTIFNRVVDFFAVPGKSPEEKEKIMRERIKQSALERTHKPQEVKASEAGSYPIMKKKK